MKIRREVKIGLFALAMLLCLYLGVNYLKGKDVFSSDKTYYALFEQTKGLQTSAAVTLRGVKIGSVTGIGIDPEKVDNVVVTFSVKKNIRIPVDSRVRLVGELLGSNSLQLEFGQSGEFFESEAVIPSEEQSNILEYASLSLEEVVAEVKKVMNSLEATSNSLNGILEQSAENINGTLRNLNSTTRQLADARIGNMLRDIGEFSAVLKNNSGRFDNIIGNLDEVSSSLAEADIKGMADTLGMSIGHLHSILAGLADSEGTAGKLLNDTALYDSLTTAAGNLSLLLEDLQTNPKRYVHFSLFGRKEKNK